MTPPRSPNAPPRVDKTTGCPTAVHWLCYALLGMVLVGTMTARLVRPFGALTHVEPERVSQVEQRIDPNVAGWAELARLPGVGRTLAQRIVAYRQERLSEGTGARVVFRRPEDLQAVPGIGPKTIAGLAGQLKLPAGEPATTH